MKKLTATLATCLLLSSCASVTVPLGENAKYGSIKVGYVPPVNLPYGISLPATLNDK